MDWPEDDGVARFEDLTTPVVEALKATYSMDLLDPKFTTDIPWTGQSTPKSLLATCFPFEKHLTGEQLRYDDEDQGRSPAHIIVGIAVQLGIEQGRRMEVEKIAEASDLQEKIEHLLNKMNPNRSED